MIVSCYLLNLRTSVHKVKTVAAWRGIKRVIMRRLVQCIKIKLKRTTSDVADDADSHSNLPTHD